MGVWSAARLPSMRKPVKRRPLAPFETISARPLKSSAAFKVEPAGLPRISRLRAPSGITSSRCNSSVPAGRSTVPVPASRAWARSVSREREQPAISKMQRESTTRTSNDLDSYRREDAPAEGQVKLMRSRRNGIRQEQVNLVALLQRVRTKDVEVLCGSAVDGRLHALRGENFLHHHLDRAADDARAGQQIDAVGNGTDARHGGSARGVARRGPLG